MRRIVLGLLLALCLASPARAWGGLFNRYNPQALISDVYGPGSYGKELYRVAEGGRPAATQVICLFSTSHVVAGSSFAKKNNKTKCAALNFLCTLQIE